MVSASDRMARPPDQSFRYTIQDFVLAVKCFSLTALQKSLLMRDMHLPRRDNNAVRPMGKHSRQPQRSGSAGKRRKRAQRIRGFAFSAGTRSVEAASDAPPAALSFPPCRKRQGRKGALGTFSASCGCNSGRNQVFRYYEHTNSPYGR